MAAPHAHVCTCRWFYIFLFSNKGPPPLKSVEERDESHNVSGIGGVNKFVYLVCDALLWLHYTICVIQAQPAELPRQPSW